MQSALNIMQAKSSLKSKMKNSMIKKSVIETPVMSIIQEESEQFGSTICKK